MPKGSFAGALTTPKVDVGIYKGNPFLNHTVDDFLKIEALKKMRKEGSYWVKSWSLCGMEYGVEKVRGTKDWKNAMIGGALAGALVSATGNNHKDKVVKDALAGGAIATAAEFL